MNTNFNSDSQDQSVSSVEECESVNSQAAAAETTSQPLLSEVQAADSVSETEASLLPIAVEEQAAESVSEVEQKPKKKGKLKMAAVIVCAVMIVLLTGTALFFNSYTVVGSMFNFKIFPVSATDIDLSNTSLESMSGIERCKALESLKVNDISGEDIKRLENCSNLKELVISSLDFDEEQVESLCDLRNIVSNCDIQFDVRIGSNTYSSDITTLELSDVGDDQVYLLGLFADLTYLDVSKCDISEELLDALKSRLPNCQINRKIIFDGVEYITADTTELKLSSDSDEELEKLVYFYNLKKVDATVCTNYDKLLEIYSKLDEGCNMFWKVNINGFELLSNQTTIDISNKKLEDESELEKLKYFTNLEKVDMCNCGYSNEEMEAFGEKYPNVRFVWMLTLGKGAWHVRTDAVVFSTLNQNDEINEYNQDMYQPLFKYCTDLIALDLGHNKITSLEGIQNLKKLRALILTDNKIKDISPLAELTELQFLEINATNRLQSLEPLRNLNKLKIINIYSSDGLTDYSPLYNKPELIYVIFPKSVQNTTSTMRQIKEFAASNPKCKYSYTSGYRNSKGLFITTTAAYGNLKYRINLKRAFAKWWSVRDDNVGDNWENLKLDSSFTNNNGEYYYNSRY